MLLPHELGQVHRPHPRRQRLRSAKVDGFGLFEERHATTILFPWGLEIGPISRVTNNWVKVRRVPTIVWILLSGFGLLLLVTVIVLLLKVDDWSRDLNTNFAATSDDARDPRLRPIHSNRSVKELAKITRDAAAPFAHWKLKSEDDQPDEDEFATLHFERSTALFGFRDDIVVRIRKSVDGCELTAESRSRIGRGDLGQNPRNLVELLEAIRLELK